MAPVSTEHRTGACRLASAHTQCHRCYSELMFVHHCWRLHGASHFFCSSLCCTIASFNHKSTPEPNPMHPLKSPQALLVSPTSKPSECSTSAFSVLLATKTITGHSTPIKQGRQPSLLWKPPDPQALLSSLVHCEIAYPVLWRSTIRPCPFHAAVIAELRKSAPDMGIVTACLKQTCSVQQPHTTTAIAFDYLNKYVTIKAAPPTTMKGTL